MLLRTITKLLASVGRPGRSGTAPGQQGRAEQLLAEGNRVERLGRMDEARDHYRAAAVAVPTYAAAHLNLGIALEALGDVETAIRSYEAALAIEPGHAYANYNLGRMLAGRGDLQRAERLLRAALASKPDFPEAQVVLSSVYESAGDAHAAVASLEAALALRPDYAGALRNYGMLLDRLGRASEAEPVLKRAIAADPADAQACYRLGKLLSDRGAPDEAARYLERALETKPDFADAHLGLGNVLANTGRLEEAANRYRRALELDPRVADARVNLGNVLKDQGLRREALECYEAAIALSPESPEARWVRLMCLIPAIRESGEDLPAMRGQFAAGLKELERWFDPQRAATGHKAVGVAQPFWLAYQEQDNRELLQRYGRLCALLMGHWQAQPAALAKTSREPGPIRVGVVSQFFRNHSVWNAIFKGWFQQLDRERFALAAFCLGAGEDRETRYARSRATRFVQGAGGLRQWVDAIAASNPDVLIYPEIGMDPISLKLASMRLAPVQAASWGHPETTGLPTIDCYLSAADLEPANAQAYYTERLVVLPNLGCYLQPETVVPAPPDLGSLGIEPDAPLLICPGTPFKYAPEHDRVLVEIARRLGRCRMVFFDYRTRTLSTALRTRLASAFAGGGLDFERYVRFVPWQTREGFFGLLGRADVFLDSIGFSGFNTALQAVQCGLPVVTLEGRFLRGRLASGILKRIGLQDLVVHDEEAYIALAVRLAQDPAYRGAVRRRIEAGRQVLFEDTAPIRALEDFLAQGV